MRVTVVAEDAPEDQGVATWEDGQFVGDRAIIDYAQEIKESPSRIDAAAVLALGAESAYGGRILVIETGEVGGPRIIADIEGADPPPLSP